MELTNEEVEELKDLLDELSRRLLRASKTMKRYALEEHYSLQKRLGFNISPSEDILETVARADLAPALYDRAMKWADKLEKSS